MADLPSWNLTLNTENLAPPGGKFKIGNFVLHFQLQWASIKTYCWLWNSVSNSANFETKIKSLFPSGQILNLEAPNEFGRLSRRRLGTPCLLISIKLSISLTILNKLAEYINQIQRRTSQNEGVSKPSSPGPDWPSMGPSLSRHLHNYQCQSTRTAKWGPYL